MMPGWSCSQQQRLDALRTLCRPLRWFGSEVDVARVLMSGFNVARAVWVLINTNMMPIKAVQSCERNRPQLPDPSDVRGAARASTHDVLIYIFKVSCASSSHSLTSFSSTDFGAIQRASALNAVGQAIPIEVRLLVGLYRYGCNADLSHLRVLLSLAVIPLLDPHTSLSLSYPNRLFQSIAADMVSSFTVIRKFSLGRYGHHGWTSIGRAQK